jgi:hypothetical protein
MSSNETSLTDDTYHSMILESDFVPSRKSTTFDWAHQNYIFAQHFNRSLSEDPTVENIQIWREKVESIHAYISHVCVGVELLLMI